jgi:hypothetical protein
LKEESDEKEKGELKARYKKAKLAHFDACDPPEIKWALRASIFTTYFCRWVHGREAAG